MKLIRLLDLIYLNFSNFIIVETKQIKEHFLDNYSVSENKFFELLSPREIDFKKLKKIKLKENTALYFGSYLPLHGVEYIIKAANILKDREVNFLLIGDGQEKHKCVSMANKFDLSNVEFIDFMDFYSENPHNSLLNYIYSSKISFGSFSTSDKNNQVIPGKIIDALACGKTVITSRTDAVKYYLNDNVVTVEPENELDLADKIIEVFNFNNFKNQENKSIEVYENLFSFKKFTKNLDKAILSI
jgi:glycosyltransferase involved in cell wall biosynthesis